MERDGEPNCGAILAESAARQLLRAGYGSRCSDHGRPACQLLLRLLAGARGVLRALHAEPIDLLFIKGAAVAPLYYGDWGGRFLANIDVAIRRQDVDRVFPVLGREGWMCLVPSAALTQLAETVRSGVFEKQGAGQLHVHWHLLRTTSSEETTGAFWQAAVPLEVDGLSARTLCSTDHLLHLCVEAEHARARNEGHWLQLVTDSLLVLDTAGDRIDWGRLKTLATDAQAGRALHAALAYLEDPLGASVPSGALAELGRLAAR